jgi:hypothetical protein
VTSGLAASTVICGAHEYARIGLVEARKDPTKPRGCEVLDLAADRELLLHCGDDIGVGPAIAL